MLNSTKERAPAEMDMAASLPSPSNKWLEEYGKHAPIALFACAAVLAHLFLRYVWPVGFYDVLPLYLALLAGGVPLLIGLGRQLLKVEFGSDWLAGFSIVTATLLHEYLVACIVVLMLSGGTALEQYATRRASSALRALARRILRLLTARATPAGRSLTSKTSLSAMCWQSFLTRFVPWMEKSLKATVRWTSPISRANLLR